ncbi:hypothetical protein RY831_12905 [Noviherbaspirillum sp. CPCC 100848]|uniref:Uncharacterized protein n=1 Tax=Noviherbaspirillum album TaxID=3080276 RepID=A0ABU6J9Q0_9BURK|nr:hypothetical protein [Noviherbaspirillum sp. CPCC 100848]MEC4720055.1 hypothetical protein [Noviherbaspirillum sp. CPCC 100848]
MNIHESHRRYIRLESGVHRNEAQTIEPIEMQAFTVDEHCRATAGHCARRSDDVPSGLQCPINLP